MGTTGNAETMWESFQKGIDTQFLSLPLSSFRLGFEFVELSADDRMREHLVTIMNSVCFDAVRASPDPSLPSFDFRVGRDEEICTNQYGHPFYGFTLQMTTSRFTLAKPRCSLESLVKTLPLLGAITALLFEKQSPQSILDHIVFEWRYRSFYALQQDFVLDGRRSDRQAVTNTELAGLMINTGQGSVCEALQPENTTRLDATQAHVIDIDGMKRNLFVTLRAPYNSTSREISLFSQLTNGEWSGQDFEPKDLLDVEFWAEALVRRTMLTKICPILFDDVKVVARP